MSEIFEFESSQNQIAEISALLLYENKMAGFETTVAFKIGICFLYGATVKLPKYIQV